MNLPNEESPVIADFDQRIDENCRERKKLIEREWELRAELQALIRKGASGNEFEEARGRERESRAELSRNLDQYDVLMEKWAAESTRE